MESANAQTGGYLTTSEAAHLLGISDQTVRRLLKGRKLDGYTTPGGHRRITRDSVDRLRNGDAA